MAKVLKRHLLSFFGCSLLLLTSCGTPSNTVSTVFIHKYGAALNEDDWVARGGNGQIVTTCKDGTTVTENYVDHLLEGKTIYSFPHSSVAAKEEQYRQGHLLSETINFTSGNPRQKMEFISDSVCHMTTWFENGNPRSIEKFIHKKLDEGEYYNTSNEIESKVESRRGTKIHRNTYGEFVSKIQYDNGLKSLETTYHANGDPKEIVPYKNSKVHGIKKFYSINGVPLRFEEWQQGVHQGKTTLFRDGQRYSEVDYVAGMKNGIETILNDHGNIACEVSWKNDLMHGVYKTYTPDSVRMEWYYRGKKVSHSDFENLAVH